MKHVPAFFKGFFDGRLGLLCLLGLAGCSNAVLQAPRTADTAPAAVLPAGTGRLTIALTETGASGEERTLFPSAPGSFSKYELVFTPESGQEGIDPVTLEEDESSYNLTLTTGGWTITALAYIRIQGVDGIANGDYVAGRGEKAVTISSSSAVNETIDLDKRKQHCGNPEVFEYPAREYGKQPLYGSPGRRV
jgi:hypothetical protein